MKGIEVHGDLMSVLVRLDHENDYRETDHISREAFWDVYKPGCDERLTLRKM